MYSLRTASSDPSPDSTTFTFSEAIWLTKYGPPAEGSAWGSSHMVLDGGQNVPVFLGGDDLPVVLNANVLRQLLGIGGFIVLLVGKAYGKGFITVGGCRNIAAVYPAAEEAAHLGIADLMSGDGILHNGVDAVYGVLKGHGLIGVEHRLPVSVDGKCSLFPQKIVGGRQSIDAAEKGFGQNRVLEGEVLSKGLPV